MRTVRSGHSSQEKYQHRGILKSTFTNKMYILIALFQNEFSYIFEEIILIGLKSVTMHFSKEGLSIQLL